MECDICKYRDMLCVNNKPIDMDCKSKECVDYIDLDYDRCQECLQKYHGCNCLDEISKIFYHRCCESEAR